MSTVLDNELAPPDSAHRPPVCHIYETGGRPCRPGDVALCGHRKVNEGRWSLWDFPEGYDPCVVCEVMNGRPL